MNENSEKMYLVAETMFREGKFDQSITILEEIIAQHPNYLPAYCLLAPAYAEQGKYEQAKRTLREGAKVGQTMSVDQTIKFLEDIITKFPDHSLAYYSLGRAYANDGKYDQAERVLREATKLDQDWYFPYLYLGWAYEKQGKWEQALDAYRAAIRLKPDDFEARAYLGYLLQQLGDQKVGVNELQIAYRLNSEDITLTHNLANGLHKLDRSAEALELLDDALESIKTNEQTLAHLYNLRGNIYLDLGELDKSLVDIQKAITLDPTVGRFYNKLGDVYFEQGDYEKAINLYNRAAESDDEKGDALKGIGRSYLRLEDWDKAVNALEKAREAGDVDYFGLGLAYFELGDDERGIENLRNEIVNDGSAKTEASYYLGFAYATTGDRESSIKAFKQFLELSTDKAGDPEWQEWRAEAKKQIEEQW